MFDSNGPRAQQNPTEATNAATPTEVGNQAEVANQAEPLADVSFDFRSSLTSLDSQVEREVSGTEDIVAGVIEKLGLVPGREAFDPGIAAGSTPEYEDTIDALFASELAVGTEEDQEIARGLTAISASFYERVAGDISALDMEDRGMAYSERFDRMHNPIDSAVVAAREEYVIERALPIIASLKEEFTRERLAERELSLAV